jgi:hypothetical protein
MARFFQIALFFFCLQFMPHQIVAQQDQMFKQKKERKRVWKRWRKDREAYNPYLNKKGKDKESARTARGIKREAKRQRKLYKRDLKKNKKRTGARSKD